MVKIKGPLFSLGAHGSLGKELTYSKRASGHQARKYNKPTVPPSPAQRGQRRLTEFLVAQWQNMTEGQKLSWQTNAFQSGSNLSGYHYFLREAQRDLYTHHGLCGYWSFNEIVSGKVLDLSGNANHGSLEPDYPTDAPTLVSSRSTRLSNALSFNGTSDYVNCGQKPRLNVGLKDFTLEAWIKAPDVATTRQFIVDWKSTGGFQFRLEPNGTLKAWVTDGVNLHTAGVTVVDNDIYHLVGLVADRDGFMQIYLNGKPEGTPIDISSQSASSYSNDVPLQIGGTMGYFFPGIIDEVVMYLRALSATEIATRYDFATRKV